MKKLKDLRKELKQRNLVHLNAPKSGAGKHVDRKRQMKQGYEWEYVGPQELDSRAKSIPLQVGKDNPFVIFKLKKK